MPLISVANSNNIINNNENEKKIEINKEDKNENNNNMEDSYKDRDFIGASYIITDDKEDIKESKVSNNEKENNNNTFESKKIIFNQKSDSQVEIKGANYEKENIIRSKAQSDKKSGISNLEIYEGGFIADSFNDTENKIPKNNNNDNSSQISDGNFIEASV